MVTRTRLGVTLHVQSRVKQNCHAAQWEKFEVRMSISQLVSLDVNPLSRLTARFFPSLS
jgi:hypothetical protein